MISVERVGPEKTTLPETNIAREKDQGIHPKMPSGLGNLEVPSLKWMVGIRSFRFAAWPILRGENVSFRECTSRERIHIHIPNGKFGKSWKIITQKCRLGIGIC